MENTTHPLPAKFPRQRVEPLSVGVEQIPGLTGIPRTTVYQMIRDGELASVKVGRRRLVLLDTLRTVLKKHEQTARGPEAA